VRLARSGWDKYAQLLTLLIDSDGAVAGATGGDVAGQKGPPPAGHGKPESVVTTNQNARSRSAGMGGHDKAESLVTINRKGWSRSTGIPSRAPWKTKESLELATLEWVSWFNHHRLLEPIGYIPPAEAEENYYRQLASQAAIPV